MPGHERLRRDGRRGFPRLAFLGCCALMLAIAVPNLRGERPGKSAKANAKIPQPEVKIPVGGLGYLAPGELPEFDYEAMVELHFIDATHLLFTFNVGGLMQRDQKCALSKVQRMVRAVVLDIPSGKVEKQTEWELFDFRDYLWGLGNGQFLLRRCSQLEILDSSLNPRPLVDAGGWIESIGFSPDRSVMVVEKDSQVDQKASAAPKKQVFGPGERPAQKVDADFIQIHPLQVIARAQLPEPGAILIVNQGILGVLVGKGNRWTTSLQLFHGSNRKMATFQSACRPRLTPVSESIILAQTCSAAGEPSFAGYDLTGLLLWRIPIGEDRQLPSFLLTRNGAHFAIEWLHTTHPLAALDPLNSKVIDAEILDIYDTTSGVLIGSLQTTPVYTAGKNADFSPDGTRIAVLHNGAIEIYSLNGLAKSH